MIKYSYKSQQHYSRNYYFNILWPTTLQHRCMLKGVPTVQDHNSFFTSTVFFRPLQKATLSHNGMREDCLIN